MKRRSVSVAYALKFKDGDIFLKSISESRKYCIKQAKDYFQLSWQEIKNKGMRCVEISIDTNKIEDN